MRVQEGVEVYQLSLFCLLQQGQILADSIPDHLPVYLRHCHGWNLASLSPNDLKHLCPELARAGKEKEWKNSPNSSCCSYPIVDSNKRHALDQTTSLYKTNLTAQGK